MESPKPTSSRPPSLFRPLTTPPANVNVLRAALGKYAAAYDVPVARVQHWVSFMVLAGALERMQHVRGTRPTFVLKGGVTLELRLKGIARATRDLDAILTVDTEDPVRLLDDALSQPYGEFTFGRSSEPRLIGPAVQIHVKLAYRGRSWGTVQLELTRSDVPQVEYEAIEAMDLSVFRLDGPPTVSCLSLRYQIAQKIHAVTTPTDERGRENPRFRDLADLLLLQGLVGDDLSPIRVACVDVFHHRHGHAWPPVITVPRSWDQAYTVLAHDLGLSTTSVYRAAEAVQQFIDRVASAT